MHDHEAIHITPLKTYLNVFGALLFLTLLTVLVAFIDLGRFNVLVAISLASVKAYVVVLYFMHVKYSNKIVWLTAAAGFIWLALMLALTLADYISRGWMPLAEPW